MKKFSASLLLFVMIFSLTACESKPASNNNASPGQVSAVPENAMNFEQPSPATEAEIAYYTQNDTFNTLTDSSPYYMGNRPSTLPGLVAFDKLKKAKIDEAIGLTKELYAAADKLREELAPFKGAYLDLLGTAREQEKKLNSFSLQTGGQIAESLAQESGIKANYESISTSAVTNPQAASLLEYQKTYLAAAYAEALINDANSFLTNAAALDAALSTNTNPTIKTALAAFNLEMEKISAIQPDFRTVIEKSAYLDTALRQIETGDYYLAQATIAFMQSQMPELKAKAASIQPSETLTQENIEAIGEYVEVVSDFAGQMETQMMQIDTSHLIPAEKLAALSAEPVVNPWGIETAFAAMGPSESEKLLSAYKAMDSDAPSTTSKIAGTLKDVASTTWSGIKSGFSKAQTVAGVTLDTVGAIVKTPMDVYHGYNENNSVSDVAGTIAGNFKQIKKNYDTDSSGSQILKDAGGYLKAAEKTAGEGAEALTEKLIGKGWTSWIAGNVASTTVGLFTGLGKGIYKVADKQATAGQMVEGMLDIGLSLIGGSKVIIKGSQALSGGKELAKWSAEKAFNFVRRMGTKLEAGELRTMTAQLLQNAKLTPNQVMKLISNSLEMEGNAALAAELKTISATLDGQFTSMIKEGIATVLKNAKSVPGTSYANWVQKSFDVSIKGLKEALVTRLGASYTAYIDNIIAAKMNGWIKSAIKEYIDAVSYDGVYSKVFPVGDGASLPVKINVENGIISGGVDYTYSHEGWSATLVFKGEGTIGEKGEITEGKWTMNLKGGGPSSSFNLFGMDEEKKCTDTIVATAGGDAKGSISADKKKFNASLTGTITANGTFWCEPIKDVNNKAIEEPLNLELTKESAEGDDAGTSS